MSYAVCVMIIGEKISLVMIAVIFSVHIHYDVFMHSRQTDNI